MRTRAVERNMAGNVAELVKNCLRTIGTANTVRYMGVRGSGITVVLKSTEGLSELSVMSWVSAVEGCLLSGVQL